MALISWKHEFNIGIPSIDAEHRQLIDLINEVHDRLTDEKRPFQVEDFLGEIHARIAAHFALEEKWMKDNDYDQYQGHKADHEKLLDDIRDIMDACDDKENFDEETLSDRLSDWFTGHFATRDARLHRFLNETT